MDVSSAGHGQEDGFLEGYVILCVNTRINIIRAVFMYFYSCGIAGRQRRTEEAVEVDSIVNIKLLDRYIIRSECYKYEVNDV